MVLTSVATLLGIAITRNAFIGLSFQISLVVSATLSVCPELGNCEIRFLLFNSRVYLYLVLILDRGSTNGHTLTARPPSRVMSRSTPEGDKQWVTTDAHEPGQVLEFARP